MFDSIHCMKIGTSLLSLDCSNIYIIGIQKDNIHKYADYNIHLKVIPPIWPVPRLFYVQTSNPNNIFIIQL